MISLIEKNVGEIVAEDYRTAAVFHTYGIDFCCNGNRTLEEVCQQKNIAPEKLKAELEKVANISTDRSIDYQSWPIDLLADYIERIHHRYVADKVPVIKQYLDKIVKVHGENHPELSKIKQLFYHCSEELAIHMRKEELVLFPFIRKMVKAKLDKQTIEKPHFVTIQNPIQMMMHEHNNEGERFRQIADLSNNYTPPQDACNTYRVAFALLKEFEADLHLHIHLENNILFPNALELEEYLN
ncbi:MAG: iron-sulfur cluster repair di-iron protein [Saprospiraceae bacterium]|nr:MAG: iron-sulfur cluster repair di-iron protein [Saprospiraceae bacterium]